MGTVVKKRQLIASTLIIALGAAIFVNWYYTRPQAKSTSSSVENTTVVSTNVEDDASLGDAQLVNASASKFFSQSKIKRNEAHDEALEALNDVIKDSSSAASAVSQAEKDLKSISEEIKLEADIENLITAKTGSNCLVIINGDKIEVIVEKGIVNETVNTQITDIIVTQDSKFSENITIIEAK